MRETRTREVYEIFDEANRKKTPEEKVAYLKDHDHLSVRVFAELGFLGPKRGWNERVVRDGRTVPYNESDQHNFPRTLRKQYKMITFFLNEAGTDHVSGATRENRAKQLLESIHPLDAKMIVDTIAGKWKTRYKGLNYDVLQATWPDIFTEDLRPKRGPKKEEPTEEPTE